MPDEPVKAKTLQKISSAVSSKAATAVKAEIKRLVTQDAQDVTNWRSYKYPHHFAVRDDAARKC
jgi:hypothetical protein